MSKTSGPNFSELVLNLKGTDSYETIEKKSNGQVSAKRLQKLVNNGFTRLPEPGLFKALALAFNISQRELVLAAARTLGIDAEADNPNDLLLIGAGKLPTEPQETLKSISRQLQRAEELARELEEVNEKNAQYLEDLRAHEALNANLNDPAYRKAHGLDDLHDNFPDSNDYGLAADKGDRNVDPEQLPDN